MKKVVHISWDFDAAIGQINASYPYNYNEQLIYEEIINVERILEIAKFYKVYFSFAITGFTAEQGIYPFHLPDLINKIYSGGHEIASHSWRHEWLPLLQQRQLYLTLERSKYILEKCINKSNSVIGLVLPHNRPMSWLGQGALSLGDRGIYPFFPGGDIGAIARIASRIGYRWIRVAYRPLWEKCFGFDSRARRKVINKHGVHLVPLTYTGFDEMAINLIQQFTYRKNDITLCGHPLMLSRTGKAESEENLIKLLDFLTINSNSYSLQSINNSYT